MKTLAKTMTHTSKRKYYLRILLIGIVTSFVLYGFAIATTTLSVADASTHSQEIDELQTEIAALEVDYFSMVNDISMEEAKVLGLSEVKDVHFARVNESKTVAYNR